MKSHKKKEKGLMANPEDLDGAAIAELATAIAEDTKSRISNEREPFEIYVQKMRSRTQHDVDIFTSRVSKGYHVLIEAMSQGQEKK